MSAGASLVPGTGLASRWRAEGLDLAEGEGGGGVGA
mgnify:FL=1